MIDFLADNLATILITLVLTGIVALIIRKLVRDKKPEDPFAPCLQAAPAAAVRTGRRAARAAAFPGT